MAAFRDLEILVAKIQRQLAPDASVQHNASLDGRKSRTKRQIDVLVEQMVGQYRMRIVIDSKDYASPVDVKGVEEFAGLVDDVGAHKGVLVCPKGFTTAAKARAADLQMELYSPIDTDPHKWQVEMTAPFLLDYRFAAYSFTVSGAFTGPFKIPDDFPTRLPLFDEAGNDLGTAIDVASSMWLDEKFSIEPGQYDGLRMFAGPVWMDDGFGGKAKIEISLNLIVESELYFGQLPITAVSGFRDEARGGVITNGFTTDMVDPVEIRKSWARVKDLSEVPVPPMLSTVVLGG